MSNSIIVPALQQDPEVDRFRGLLCFASAGLVRLLRKVFSQLSGKNRDFVTHSLKFEKNAAQQVCKYLLCVPDIVTIGRHAGCHCCASAKVNIMRWTFTSADRGREAGCGVAAEAPGGDARQRQARRRAGDVGAQAGGGHMAGRVQHA